MNDHYDFIRYSNTYPDLKKAFKENIKKLKEHYYRYGKKEGRQIFLKELSEGATSDTCEEEYKNTDTFLDTINVEGTSKLEIVLFTTYYLSKNNTRKEENKFCLENNIKNSVFTKIYVVSEDEEALLTIPEQQKLIKIKTETRPSFTKMLSIMNETNLDNTFFVLANTDIIFDDSLLKIQHFDKNDVLCLSRWDLETNFTIKPYYVQESQDTWVFCDLPKILSEADFQFGIPGCDNRFAKVLRDSGYNILNPMKDIVTVHVHLSQFRTYKVLGYNDINVVPGPYELVVPMEKKINFNYISKTENFLRLPEKSEWIPKKVLHIGINQFDKVFKQNTTWYKFISKNEPNFKDLVINQITMYKPDLVFAQIQEEGVLTQDFASKIKSFNVQLINWTGDVRSPIPTWFYKIGKIVDLTLFSNDTDAKKMRQDGFNAHFLQIGYNETIYKPLDYKIEKKGIVFFGNNYGKTFPLSEYRYIMVKNLKKMYGSFFSVYGDGWPSHYNAINLNDNYIEESRILASSEIVISVSHFDYSRYFSDRLIRALGCGAFVISHNYQNITDDFIVGEHLVVFRNLIELQNKINYYLNHKDMAIKIAKEGQNFARLNCTNRNRLDEMQYQINKNIQ
jgi:spore maturation protein CgeB